MSRPVRVAVFASGGGSNFQALLDREREGGAPWETVLLIADRASAGALERAEAAGIPTAIVSFRQRDMDEVDAEMVGLLDQSGVEAIFPPGVVQRWRGRLLNLHPGLLPAFGGKGMWGQNVHRAVLEAGARISGPTVHLVDEIYDRGLILAQWPVPVLAGDTPESLGARVLAIEHRLYPRVAEHLCEAIRAGREVTPIDIGSEGFVPAPAD